MLNQFFRSSSDNSNSDETANTTIGLDKEFELFFTPSYIDSKPFQENNYEEVFSKSNKDTENTSVDNKDSNINDQSLLNKKSQRKPQKTLEEIRAKNRERTKKSREKKIKDLQLLLLQFERLKKENAELKSRIKFLCPNCQNIFTGNISSYKNNNTANNSSDQCQCQNKKFTITNGVEAPLGNFTKRITPLFAVIALICIVICCIFNSNMNSNQSPIMGNPRFPKFINKNRIFLNMEGINNSTKKINDLPFSHCNSNNNNKDCNTISHRRKDL